MSDCIEWPHSRTAQGYGRYWDRVKKRRKYVHRKTYEDFNGPIPEGMLVLHSCDNPPCYNPEHLRVGTYSDNAQDREDRGRGRQARARVALADMESAL
jgi:hypothetical protein